MDNPFLQPRPMPTYPNGTSPTHSPTRVAHEGSAAYQAGWGVGGGTMARAAIYYGLAAVFLALLVGSVWL